MLGFSRSEALNMGTEIDMDHIIWCQFIISGDTKWLKPSRSGPLDIHVGFPLNRRKEQAALTDLQIKAQQVQKALQQGQLTA